MAAEAAFGVGAAGLGLFGYNRSNFQYDSTFRYERFTAGREFAIAQTEQYRNDLRALSALTQKKNTTYAVVASLCMALCVALYCAGRLGLHGPSPPAWIMGLWYTNNAAAFSFMALAIWLATHASFRAQAASVHLLTRKTRVPVPTLKQLDTARRFGSEFEQQSWGDIFRVPYISNNGAPKTDSLPTRSSSENAAGARSRSAPPGRRSHSKASTWIREEFETDKAGTVTGSMPELPVDAAPEHFRLYTAAQKEWFAYDIYARVCLLYGFLSFVHALGYYGLGHINIELRAFWVAYATGFVLMVLHALLLRFDIIRGRGQNEMLPHCQWLGPLAWLPAAIGMSLDFRVQFSYTAVVICWILIFISYLLQLVYTLRLLEVVLPDDWRTPMRPEERIGAAWWPESWRIPSSFQHVLYLVAPPQRLQPGQHDIVREVREGTSSAPEDAGVAQSQPSVGTPLPPQEDLFSQMQYVDRLFDEAFSDRVFDRMSSQGQSQVRALYHGYAAARAKQSGRQPNSDPELAQALKECIAGLNAILTEEGMQNPAGGYISGYDSTGTTYSSGVASSGSERGMKSSSSPYTDNRQLRKLVPPFVQTQHIQPWRLVSSIVLMLCVAWVFLIGGCIIDVALGEQALVTAPHWSRPPMTRLSLEPHELGTPIGFPWPAGAKPWIPEQMAWHEEKREAESETLGARRLSAPAGPWRHGAGRGAGLSVALEALLAVLGPSTAEVAPAQAPEAVEWPSFFEPQLLACGPPVESGGSVVAALTSRGFGAAVHVKQTPGAASIAEPFTLSGLSGLPPLVGASWGLADSDGLFLVTREGHLVSCPGPRPGAGGIWACMPAAGSPGRLPLAEGARLSAAAVAWLPGLGGAGGTPRLHVALLDDSTPDLVALFVQEGEGQVSSWLPFGEVSVPVDMSRAVRTSLAFVGSDLLLATDSGTILQRRLKDGAVVASATDGWGFTTPAASDGSWRTACGVQHAPAGSVRSVVHLHLRTAPGAYAQRPELTAVDIHSQGEGKAALYQ